MKKYIVEINDNEYEVTIREKGEKKTGSNSTSSSIDQTNKKINEVEENKSETSTIDKSVNRDLSSDDNEVVSAPMSGKILSIRVESGDIVEKNQVLMTLEAMKMETEIVAPEKGKIVNILADEGSKCKQGDKLALIEAGDN